MTVGRFDRRRTLIGTVAVAAVATLGLVALLRDDSVAVDASCGEAPPGPGALVSFAVGDGRVDWSTLVGQTVGAAPSGDVVVIRTIEHRLRAIDIGSGAIRWCRELAASSEGDRDWGLAAEGAVVATFDGDELVGVASGSGEIRWATDVPFAEGGVKAGDGLFWVGDGRAFGEAAEGDAAGDGWVAFDPATGHPVLDPGERAPMVGFPGDFGLAHTGAVGATLEVQHRGSGQVLGVRLRTDEGDELWTADVPGYVAAVVPSAVGPVVVVLDQTGFTGRPTFPAEDVLTGYGTDGEVLWQLELSDPASPWWGMVGDLLAVPLGTDVAAIDPADGHTVWRGGAGSPGRSSRFSEEGSHRFVVDGDRLIGLVEAQEPYRG